uniref:Major facilitator superfamily (MFS) profile domain-containing protein n=1 Tax=Odontella aurita TaxID=265563 RepID=A0A7S4HZM8_9STRA|mmetsp:Transcript_17672/g.51433  ORF Transcript_17672/g.51433 Transcript_17672/m.51433 type:complete len:692 (+) Transcript_17672:176-2251(+)
MAKVEWLQFALLIVGLVCMGAGTGFERSLLPRMAVDIFHETSASTRLNFVATFGGFKAVANVLAGPLADRYGRKLALALGFLVGLPVMPYVIFAKTWTGICVMNVAFGLSQGLLGSALFFLLIDVMGPNQRGVAVGVGECAIFVTTALVNMWAGHLATKYGYRPVPFYCATAFCALGLMSVIPLRDTLDKVHAEQSERSLHEYSSSDDDVEDDLSDEADIMEYGLRPDGWQVAVAPPRSPLETISMRTEATEAMSLVSGGPIAAEEDATKRKKPTMERVWSGDFEDFESDLERMLKTVKGVPPRKGGDEGTGTHFSDSTFPSKSERSLHEVPLMPLGSPKERRGHLPPSARGHRRGASETAPNGDGEGSAGGGHIRHHRRRSSGPSGSGEVRLVAETQWAKYMSIEPPSAVAAAKKAKGVTEQQGPAEAAPRRADKDAPGAVGTREKRGSEMIPDPPLEVMARLLTNTNYVSLCFTGMAINFKDGFAWGTFPVFFSNVHHLSDSRTDLLIALYPLCWGLAQAFTGAASDQFGRQLFLTSGMATCTVAMLLFALPGAIWGGRYQYLGEVDAAGFVWIVADILLGLGTALVYPALQAGAADEVDPLNRGLGLGFYRFVRDMGYVLGALVCGRLTDSIGYQATFLVVAAVLGAGTYLMVQTYTPRRKVVLIGGGRRIVLKRKESEAAMSVGYAD